MVSRGDFHCHSTASDGVLPPAEVVELAYQQGVRVLALTDHDSVEGIGAARRVVERHPDLTLIPGVEMGTDIPGAEVHVLGYFLKPEDAALQTTLKKLRDSRRKRGEGMVIRLREMGFDVTWEQVQRIAGDGAVGRPHVAQALHENGHVATVKEAFDKYIGRNGPAYVDRVKMTPADAVATIAKLGGVPCLAHPREITKDDEKLQKILAELKTAGLVGMEVYYKDYDLEEVERLRLLAEKFGLLPLGGSDYHGIFGQEEPLPGQMYSPVPDASIDALLALGRERAAEKAR
ncbi:MAG: PHP domain-containing protein [Dehalococcoidia bacterium]